MTVACAAAYRLSRSWRSRHQFYAFSEVLVCCRQEELVFGVLWSAAARLVRPEDACGLGEEYLDLLSSPAGVDTGVYGHDTARQRLL